MEDKLFEIVREYGQNTKVCTAKLREEFNIPEPKEEVKEEVKIEIVEPVKKVVTIKKEVKKVIKKKGGR